MNKKSMLRMILLRTILIASVMMTFLFSVAAAPAVSEASTILVPTVNQNLCNYGIRYSYMETTDQGYMRLFYKRKTIYIEYYDQDFDLIEKKTMEMELPVWGGFYKGNDAYYLVEGRKNEDCVDGTEVLRIIKYDMSWNRLGSGSINAQEGWEYEIRYPFDASCVNMTEAGGKLYVVTGREGYVDDMYGQGHQGMMLIRMDESSFDTEIVYGDFWHSFAQYLASKGTDIYLYEQSEGSRATYLSCFDGTRTGTDYFDAFSERFSVFDYGGERDSALSIDCYASADDVALSSNNILGLGTSIDQSKYDIYNGETDPYNIYLTVTPLSNLSGKATKIKWLTSYSNKDTSFWGINMTKINDDRFMVLWEENGTDGACTDPSDSLSGNKIHYIFIDGDGNIVSKKFTQRAAISDCHPIVSGNKVVYHASYDNNVNFYTINTENGSFSKRVYDVSKDPDPEHSVSNAKVSGVKTKMYTGKSVAQAPVVKIGRKTLIEGTDYTVSYKNNNSVGTAKVTIKGIGKCHGTQSKSFKIVPKGTTVSTLSPKAKALTVKWRKQTKQTSGYQIQYAYNKGFTKGKKTVTVKGNGTSSRKITKLKAKKLYYVRIRTYKTVNGKKYCSSWSKVKTKKTK